MFFHKIAVATMLLLATVGVAISAKADGVPSPTPQSLYPPCAVITIKEGEFRALPSPDPAATPLPQQVGHCWLKPGLIKTFVHSNGKHDVWTFWGYLKPLDPTSSALYKKWCKGNVPPCYLWRMQVDGWDPSVLLLDFQDEDLSYVMQHGQDDGPGEPPLIVRFRWPLTVHDSFSPPLYKDTFNQLIKSTITVVGWETITVPAGQFRTIHVHAEERVADLGKLYAGATRTIDTFYDPSLGIIVKWIGEDQALERNGNLIRRAFSDTWQLSSIGWLQAP